jgi:hypothetical protein
MKENLIVSYAYTAMGLSCRPAMTQGPSKMGGPRVKGILKERL